MYGWLSRQLVNPVIIEEKQDDGHIRLNTDCFKTVTEKSANGMIETSFSWNKNIYRNVYIICSVTELVPGGFSILIN